jgi:hypothetical protein
MFRPVVAGLMASLLAPVAMAKEGPDVCILQATETLTSPKKPNIFTMRLDCGEEPTVEQETAVAMISAKENTADSVSYMLGAGFDLSSSTTMVSYTGNAVITTFVFAKSPVANTINGYTPIMAPPAGMDDLDDLPEASEPDMDDDGEMLDLGGDESMDDESMEEADAEE